MRDVDVPKIKFCGITNLDDADAAVAAGAWALGVILWPRSPRRCRPAVAAQIAATHRRHVQVAGVFVNPTLDQVERAADELGLTMLQLHGTEGPSFCSEAARRTGCRIIKAARIHSGADIQALTAFLTDFHLLDAYVAGQPGGTGQSFSWDLARGHRGRTPLILAGGLTADNVGEAIAVVRPYAVDVASGVESAAGIKDHAKLHAFAAAVAATAPAPVAAEAPAAAEALDAPAPAPEPPVASEQDAA
jgi:phosphoribosylanthranilate isomerase